MSIFCNEKKYDEYKPDFDAIVKCFAFRDKTAVADGVVDEDTPAGMKRVSFDGCEYLFYAPTSWKCNMTDKLTEAYFSESDKSNITVTSFAPDDPMTAEEYVESCKITYAKELAGYSYISVSDARIDDRGENDYIPAKKYSYSVASSGKQYKIMQTVFVYNNMVYSITYTSAVENFDSHISDVNSMLLAFRFR